MTRKTAIRAAKQAYRIFLSQHVQAPGFTPFGNGYICVLPDWEICLTADGTVDGVIKLERELR